MRNERATGVNSFGVIFVLYRPTDSFLQNLEKAREACPVMIVVDNSPDEDFRLHEVLRERGIQVIFNRNEGGLAGAYNRGIELLLARECDVVFLLDQDSDIDAGFFAGMMEAAKTAGSDTFLIGPKIYELKLEKCMPVLVAGKWLPKTIRIDDEMAGLFSTLCIISSGSAISAAAYRKLGAFREDYFIEYIDVEYSLRAHSYGVPVYMNAAVTLRQSQGHIERRGKLFTTHHAAWRRYYTARNSIHCLRLYRESCGMHGVSGLMVIQQALSVLLFDSHKLKKIVALTLGCLDGMFGKLGTFESLHPYVAAFCKRTGSKVIAVSGNSSVMATEQ